MRPMAVMAWLYVTTEGSTSRDRSSRNQYTTWLQRSVRCQQDEPPRRHYLLWVGPVDLHNAIVGLDAEKERKKERKRKGEKANNNG